MIPTTFRVWPARTVDTTDGYNDSSIPDRRAKCYSTALYSDDHGKTIHRANVFLQGTGEACLIERLDGIVYFNARAYFNDHRRRTALSSDAGRTFGEEGTDPSIVEINQGTCAGMVRYPPKLIGDADLALVKGLKSADDEVRLAAARSLGQIGPRAAPAVPALAAVAESRDLRLVILADEALTRIGNPAQGGAKRP